MKLAAVPIELGEANAFVAEHHRHHRPVVGHKFSIGATAGDSIVGVAIVGRPVSRMRDDGLTLEVTRLCTDGTRKRIGTYILKSETGASLKAANWKLIGERGGGSWSVPSRPRVDKHPTQRKLLFEAIP